MLISLIFLFALTINKTSSSGIDNNTSSLQLLQVVSRHGARTTNKNSYPNDPNNDYFKLGEGQLSKEGTILMYEFGETIRKRYSNFIVNDYRTVLAKSSIVPRCIQSGAAMLSVIYPKPTYQDLKNGNYDKSISSIQAIPIYASPTQCPDGIAYPASDYNAMLGNLDDLFIRQFSTEHMTTLKKDFAEATGLKNVTVNDITSALDALTTEEYHNLALPSWYKSLKSRMIELNKGYFKEIATNSTLNLKLGGPILEDIVNNLETSVKTKDTDVEINSFYFFTHDIIISPLLGCLGITLDETPPFGATVLIEKHLTGNGTEYVKFFYLPTPDAEVKQLFSSKITENYGAFTIKELRDIVNSKI